MTNTDHEFDFRQRVTAFLGDLRVLTLKHRVKIVHDIDSSVLLPLGDDEHGGRYEIDYYSGWDGTPHGLTYECEKS